MCGIYAICVGAFGSQRHQIPLWVLLTKLTSSAKRLLATELSIYLTTFLVSTYSKLSSIRSHG